MSDVSDPQVEARELDTWLAEHLFGFKVSQPDMRGKLRIIHPERKWTPLKHYSTTGDGMLLVAQALIERGLCWSGGEAIDGAYAVVSTFDATSEWECSHATLPMALALAAKAALEVEVHRQDEEQTP